MYPYLPEKRVFVCVSTKMTEANDCQTIFMPDKEQTNRNGNTKKLVRDDGYRFATTCCFFLKCQTNTKSKKKYKQKWQYMRNFFTQRRCLQTLQNYPSFYKIHNICAYNINKYNIYISFCLLKIDLLFYHMWFLFVFSYLFLLFQLPRYINFKTMYFVSLLSLVTFPLIYIHSPNQRLYIDNIISILPTNTNVSFV